MSPWYEMAAKYYPRLWDTRRLELLVQAGRLTQAEADQIMARATS